MATGLGEGLADARRYIDSAGAGIISLWRGFEVGWRKEKEKEDYLDEHECSSWRVTLGRVQSILPWVDVYFDERYGVMSLNN